MTTQGGTARAWARGGTVFAATVMIILGVYQVLLGLAAIIEDEFFVVRSNYVYEIDTTAWGWIHLVIGALVAVAGFFLFTGNIVARAVAIGLAAISAIANFFFIPYYPFWSLLIIAVDIFVIWAIATAGERVPVEPSAMAGGAGAFAGEPAQTGDRWPAAQPAGRHAATEAAQARPETAAPTAAPPGYATPPDRPPEPPPAG